MAKAPSTAARLAPAGRAVLLLGIGALELAGRRFVIDGRRISAVRHGRVALLLTYVDPNVYANEALEGVRADPTMLANEARSYQRALERAAVHAPIVPAGLLTVFASGELDAQPQERIARWTRSLARLGEKRECVLVCYVGPHPLPAFEPYALRIAARTARAQRTPPGALPRTPGRVPHASGDAIADHLETVWKACAPIAISSRRLRPVSPRERFGVALLIDSPHLDRLRETIAREGKAGAALGAKWYCEGPRLPFSFV